MAALKMDPRAVLLLLAAGGLVLWIGRRGITGAASDAGAAAVDAAVAAAGGALSAGVGAVSTAVGIPTPYDTTTDARVARWIADNHGWLTASIWSGAPALFAATSLPVGSGTPPAAGSPAGLALLAPLPTTGDFARMDRAWTDPTAPWMLPAGGYAGDGGAAFGIYPRP